MQEGKALRGDFFSGQGQDDEVKCIFEDDLI